MSERSLMAVVLLLVLASVAHGQEAKSGQPPAAAAAPGVAAQPAPAPADAETAEAAPADAETAPAETAPAETAPAETAPAETAPAEAAPAETAPAEAAPAEAAPEPVPTEAAPAPAEAEAPAPAAEAVPQQLPVDEPALDTPVRDPGFQFGAGLAVGVLNLPKLGAGLQLYMRTKLPGFIPLELSASYFFANRAALDLGDVDYGLSSLILVFGPDSNAHVDYQVIQLSAALCPANGGVATGQLSLCAGPIVGAITSDSGNFVVAADDPTRALFAFEAYARFRFQAGDTVGLSYSIGLFVPVIRDRFGYADRSGEFRQHFRQAPVGGRFDLLVTFAP
ncbi:MAG: hypothetical protein OEZ06_05070 [Myxococcales bacterium]|nr:hypothetical protein [Myxococcales bacterium]